jgi:hypothetical protein
MREDALTACMQLLRHGVAEDQIAEALQMQCGIENPELLIAEALNELAIEDQAYSLLKAAARERMK